MPLGHPQGCQPCNLSVKAHLAPLLSHPSPPPPVSPPPSGRRPPETGSEGEIDVLRQVAGMPALGVLEERFGFSCISPQRFGPHESVFLAVYGGRVCCIYTILLRKSISDPPLARFIFCTTPHTLG